MWLAQKEQDSVTAVSEAPEISDSIQMADAILLGNEFQESGGGETEMTVLPGRHDDV